MPRLNRDGWSVCQHRSGHPSNLTPLYEIRHQCVTINCNVTGLTFWYGSYSQGHSNLKIVHSPSQPAASMDRVIKVSHVDGPHSHTDHTDDLQIKPKQSYLDSCCYLKTKQHTEGQLDPRLGQLLSKLVQFLLQRGPLGVSGGHLITDFPNLRLHPCCHYNADGSASCNIGTLAEVQFVSTKMSRAAEPSSHSCC